MFVFAIPREIAEHRARYPNNALIVVRSIVLRDGAEGPLAEGGELQAIAPWEVRDEELRPLAYQYAVPADDD